MSPSLLLAARSLTPRRRARIDASDGSTAHHRPAPAGRSSSRKARAHAPQRRHEAVEGGSGLAGLEPATSCVERSCVHLVVGRPLPRAADWSRRPRRVGGRVPACALSSVTRPARRTWDLDEDCGPPASVPTASAGTGRPQANPQPPRQSRGGHHGPEGEHDESHTLSVRSLGRHRGTALTVASAGASVRGPGERCGELAVADVFRLVLTRAGVVGALLAIRVRAVAGGSLRLVFRAASAWRRGSSCASRPGVRRQGKDSTCHPRKTRSGCSPKRGTSSL